MRYPGPQSHGATQEIALRTDFTPTAYSTVWWKSPS